MQFVHASNLCFEDVANLQDAAHSAKASAHEHLLLSASRIACVLLHGLPCHMGAQCKNSTTPGCLKSDLRYWTASSLARSSAMVACNCLWRFCFWSMAMTLKPRAYKVAESLAHPAHSSMQRSEFIGAPWKVELFGETEGPAASAGRHCCSQLFWLCAPPHLVHT